jgi:RNA-directed DNA polymerase
MKESYGKDPASHPDPESCVGGREDAGEALTGAHAGQPLSSEITLTGVPAPYGEGEGNIRDSTGPLAVIRVVIVAVATMNSNRA